MEPVEEGASLVPSRGFSQGWPGSLLSQLFFELVKLPDELHDEGCIPFFGFESLVEFSPNMSHAASELGLVAFFLIAGVGAIAIALQEALKACSEDIC